MRPAYCAPVVASHATDWNLNPLVAASTGAAAGRFPGQWRNRAA